MISSTIASSSYFSRFGTLLGNKIIVDIYLFLISDLSKNWSIDIAQELEAYLEELEEISFTFEGGHSNLNFAEAALLIQVHLNRKF